MYDVFISYNWAIKAQVQKLYQVLTSLNYKVWMDERDLNTSNNPLTAELTMAIKNSKVILSCITKEYCASYNCNLEIEYASAKKKQIIALMIEEIDLASISEILVTGRGQASAIGFIIT